MLARLPYYFSRLVLCLCGHPRDTLRRRLDFGDSPDIYNSASQIIPQYPRAFLCDFMYHFLRTSHHSHLHSRKGTGFQTAFQWRRYQSGHQVESNFMLSFHSIYYAGAQNFVVNMLFSTPMST